MVVEILTTHLLLFLTQFDTAQERVAGPAKFLLVINDVGTVLAAMLIVAEQTISLEGFAVFKSFFDQGGIVTV